MLVTLFGMVMEVKPVQNRNASSPMVETLFGMVMEVRPWQLENAPSPMLVTLFGFVMEVRPWQLENAELPMLETPCSIITVLIEARISYQGLPPHSQSLIAPVPLIVSVPSTNVAITSAAFGEPICHVCAVNVVMPSIPQINIIAIRLKILAGVFVETRHATSLLRLPCNLPFETSRIPLIAVKMVKLFIVIVLFVLLKKNCSNCSLSCYLTKIKKRGIYFFV